MLSLNRVLRALWAALFLGLWPLYALAQISGSGGVPVPVINGDCLIGQNGQAVWGGCTGTAAVQSVTGTAGQVLVSPTTGNTVVSLPATITSNENFTGTFQIGGNTLAPGGALTTAGAMTTTGAASPRPSLPPPSRNRCVSAPSSSSYGNTPNPSRLSVSNLRSIPRT